MCCNYAEVPWHCNTVNEFFPLKLLVLFLFDCIEYVSKIVIKIKGHYFSVIFVSEKLCAVGLILYNLKTFPNSRVF